MDDLIYTCKKKGFKEFGTLRLHEYWVKNENETIKIRLTDFDGKYSADIRRAGRTPESFASKNKQKVIDYLNIEL